MFFLLKKLTEICGVSGCETPVRQFIENEIKDHCTSIRTDSMGNLIAFKESASGGGKTVLLSAHMDEVGFIVTAITPDGYLKLDTVGGFDERILASQRVKCGDIYGVISYKAVHLTDKDERKKKPSVEDFYIDIGAKDKETAEKYIMPGDCFAFDSDYTEFGDYIKAKALDDRVGCAIMIEMLKKTWNVNLYCTFTVQEEVGLRGATAAVYGINPDYALVIEGTTCNDLPNVGENLRVTKSGNGAAISVLDSASRANSEVVALLKGAAEKNGIPWQFKASTSGGNDAGAICIANGGIRVASLSVPCRYIHSPVCVMHKEDFMSCKQITAAFLKEI